MNNLIRPSKAYWIWGLFPINEKIILNSLQYQVQKVLESPKFEAHITLSGPFPKINSAFLKKLKMYSKNKNSVFLDVKGYDHKREKYESFFISIRNSLNLRNLRNDINKLTNPKLNKEYNPHISLSYGNHKKKEKELLIANLPKLQQNFKISRIAIAKVDENINLWDIIEIFDLEK